jgi:acyl carrier protein/NAD(P)-dependent dehydrogenase (short-subunit alcohol dehydrogenase family)
VADAESLSQLFANLTTTMPPLRGVIHAAGVLDDGVLRQQTPKRFAPVMRPKIAGAWNLHTLTREHPLDFFVLFSSIASILGPGGQGNYASANAFLDTLAHFRRANHLPALSINWGPWAEAGMAASLGEAGQQRFSAIGIEPIPTEEGFDALGRLLRERRIQALVLPVDWRKYLRQFEGRDPALFRNLAPRTPARRSSAPAISAALTHPPEDESPEQLRARLSKLVEHQARKILGLDDSRPLDFGQPLTDLGLDSLLAVEFLNALSKSTGRQLPTSLVFNQPTIDAVTDYLVRDVGGFDARS